MFKFAALRGHAGKRLLDRCILILHIAILVALTGSALSPLLHPQIVHAAAPAFSVLSWKDGQSKVVLEFDQEVLNESLSGLDAADFVVAGANSIGISSVDHSTLDNIVVLTLASNLDSGSGTDFTISCASNAIFNQSAEACSTSSVNVYTSVAEDTTGPSVIEASQESSNSLFVEFDEPVDRSTLTTSNISITTSDVDDTETISSIFNFDEGTYIVANGASISTGSGNTVTIGTGVKDVVGNASVGETVTLYPSIKISEVKISEANNTKDEFIELYNNGDNSVDLSNLKLHIWDGSTDTNLPLTQYNTTIPANGFYLIGTSSYSGSVDIDARYSTSSAQLVDNGAVYISLSDTADTDVIDLVGWGTSSKKEGTALSNPNAGESIERKSELDSTGTSMASGSDQYLGNSEDSGNNSSDFVSQSTPVPQNSQSSIEYAFGSEFNSGGDSTAPTVVDSYPSVATASYIPVDLDVAVAVFSEVMDSSTLTTSTVKLTADSDPSTNLCGSVTYDAAATSGAELTCTISAARLPLAATAHTFTITTGAQDISGNGLSSDFSISFTPSVSFDFDSDLSPTAQTYYPKPGSTSFPVGGDELSVTFDQSLDASTVTTANVEITDTTTNTAITETGVSTATVDDTNDTILIDVSGVTFTEGDNYQVALLTGITSADGVALTATVTWSFTVAAADTTGPIVESAYPANGDTGIYVGDPYIFVTFDEALTSSTINSNTVKLLQGSDQLSPDILYNPTYRALEISLDQAFDPNTTYTVTLGASGNDSEITNVSGVALQDTDGTSNGVYSFSFTTSNETDSIAPGLSYATGSDQTIYVTFTESVSESAVTNLDNWELQSPIGTTVPLSSLSGNTTSWDDQDFTLKIEGLSLTAGDTFQLTAGTAIKDLSGNAIPSSTSVSGTVMDSDMYGDSFAPGETFTGDYWELPTGWDFESYSYVPQASAFPENSLAGQSSVWVIDVPITEQIRSQANGGKMVLTFPTGFDVTNAAVMSGSSVNNDANGWNPGTVAVNSVSSNASARTVTIDFTTATRCGSGNTDPCVSGSEADFISLDLKGIVNTTTARDWETSGYSVDIKTMTNTTVLETFTSMPFYIEPAGNATLSVDVTAGSENSGKADVHIWSSATGELIKTIDFSTEGDGTAAAMFSGIPAGYYDVWTDSPLSIGTADDYVGIDYETVYVAANDTTTKSYTLTDTSSLTSVTVNVNGVTGKSIDIVANSATDWVKKNISNTNGTDSVTLKLSDGDWFLQVMPHMPNEGGYTAPEPQDYILSPTFLELNVNGTTVTETSGTANDGVVTFTTTSTDHTIDVKVVDNAGKSIVGAQVFADSTNAGYGTFAETSSDGTATLSVNTGTYRLGAFIPGTQPSREVNVRVDSSGNVYQDGSNIATSLVTIKLSKGGQVISGTVTNGTQTVSGAAVHAFCTANCTGYFDAFTKTGSNGTYTLYVDDGTWQIQAYVPGYGDTPAISKTVSGADISDVALSISSDTTFRTISGTICEVDGGGTNCNSATGMDDINIYVHGASGTNYTRTNSDGTYSVQVPSGSDYTIEVIDPLYGPLATKSNVDVSSGNATGQNVVLDTPETVTISIVDSDNNPVVMDDLFLEFFDDVTEVNFSTQLSNVSSGSIDIPEGSYDIFIHSTSTDLDENDITAGGAGTTVSSGVLTVDGSESIIVTVPTLNTISGQLTDGTDPVEDAWVEFTNTASGSKIGLGDTTDSSGNYSVKLPDGTYQVQAFNPGLVVAPVILTVDGNETLNLTGVANDTTITGTITDPNGNVVPYPFVVAEKMGGGTVMTKGDADGTYVLNVGDGEWAVTANAYGYAEKSLNGNVIINGSSSAGNDIQFSSTVTLSNPETKTITPSQGGIVSETDINTNVTIPANALSTSSSAGSVTVKETNNVADTATTDVIGNGFEVTAVDSGGTSLTEGFAKKVTLDKTIAVSDLATYGIDTKTEVDQLNISYYSSNGTWQKESTTIKYLDSSGDVVAAGSVASDLSNVQDIQLTTKVDHFTVFSITTARDGVAPATPANVSTVTGTGAVTINWDAVTTNADSSAISDLAGYEIYRDTSLNGSFSTQLNSSDITTTSYTDTTALVGTTYYYKVTAADTGGNESSKTSAVSGYAKTSSSSSSGGASTVGELYGWDDSTTAEDASSDDAQDSEDSTDESTSESGVSEAPSGMAISPVTGEMEAISTVTRSLPIRGSSYSSVYHVTEDYGRRVYINEQAYFTWNDDYEKLSDVTDATLTVLPFEGVILPKAGVVMVKIQSDPRVYWLEENPDDPFMPILRWVTDEEVAKDLFGEEWADYIIDIEPTFFARFQAGGEDIDEVADIEVNLDSMKKRESLVGSE